MTSSGPTEKTFTSYNKEQGKAYAQARRDYHSSVYDAILHHHTTTGGTLDTLLDIGCGPGTATHTLAAHFTHALGLDPSEGMLATARTLHSVTATGEPVRFALSTAETLGADLAPPVPAGSIDLLTAANAAHWFALPAFWRAAARVLRPGGTVALWTSGPIRAHPDGPAAAAVQALLDAHDAVHLRAYDTPGNALVRGRYRDLALPWGVEPAVEGFEEGGFVRREWEVDEVFFAGLPEGDLDLFERVMATASAQTRWNQAHPEDVGTERDVVKILRKDIERVMHEAGVEKGKERIKGAVQGTLLMLKKKKESAGSSLDN